MATKNKYVWELLPWDIQVDILSRLSAKDLCGLQSVCKDWQSLIKSPRFHILQINANPNQDSIIMHLIYGGRACLFQSLSSNEIYTFDVIIANIHNKTLILAISNGLVFVVNSNISGNYSLLVFNPITKECKELPQLPISLTWLYYNAICDFEHDLQFSTYKIFLIFNLRCYIYKSSSHTWQSLNFFYNFKSNLQLESMIPFSCKFYKNNIYVVFNTPKYKVMMVVYDPRIDTWNSLDLNIKNYERILDGKLIIADDHLFFVQINGMENNMFIFEVKNEDRLLISIIKVIQLRQTQLHSFHSIFGFGNKITMIDFREQIGFTYNVDTNKQESFKVNKNFYINDVRKSQPFIYTLVSPNCKQT